MKKIKVFNGIEPCLNENDGFGLHRDRHPDSGWGELRNTIISEATEVQLTSELKIRLIEDIAYWCGNNTRLFSKSMIRHGLYEI